MKKEGELLKEVLSASTTEGNTEVGLHHHYIIDHTQESQLHHHYIIYILVHKFTFSRILSKINYKTIFFISADYKVDDVITNYYALSVMT